MKFYCDILNVLYKPRSKLLWLFILSLIKHFWACSKCQILITLGIGKLKMKMHSLPGGTFYKCITWFFSDDFLPRNCSVLFFSYWKASQNTPVSINNTLLLSSMELPSGQTLLFCDIICLLAFCLTLAFILYYFLINKMFGDT